jgi:aminoglycoside phosphotransferase (APT) family kinase protein
VTTVSTGGAPSWVDRLAAVVDADRIDGLTRLTGGASRETWAFTAVGPAGARELILQRQRGGAERPGGGMAVEGELLRRAAIAGVPVAPLVAASSDPADLGVPYLVMERVPGETIARKILRDEPYAEARRMLPAQLGAALGRIHGIDALPAMLEQDRLTYYRAVLDALGQYSPAFELGFRVLEANRPARTRTTVVHGDYRLGNVIVGPDGLRAVLDWELAHVGDPAEDLGWLCVRAWRFGGAGPVAGLGGYETLCEAYGEASGVTISVDVVRWWEAVGVLAWGVMCMLQAAAHLSGMSRSHELAAIGRRVCENEFDLLELLP